LTAVWDQPGTLASLLADLRRWELLYEEPTAEDSLYFFRHVLTQEAVYQTLLTNRRRSLRARLSAEYFGYFRTRLVIFGLERISSDT